MTDTAAFPKSLEAFTGGLESASVLAGQAEKELAKKAADLFGTVRKFTGENDNEGFKTASRSTMWPDAEALRKKVFPIPELCGF